MKLEKISDTQVRVVLNKSDLLEREIKISELAYGSDKAQKLFKDMMDKAHDEFGFDADNVPLMIEAVPLSTDSIMIIVTKVNDPDEIDDKLANLTANKNIRKFKKKTDAEVIDIGDKLEKREDADKESTPTTAIYAFDKLDHIIHGAQHVESTDIRSSLFRDEKNRAFYLVLQSEKSVIAGMDKVLIEYGRKISSTDVVEAFLLEHGDTMIKEHALEKLKLI